MVPVSCVLCVTSCFQAIDTCNLGNRYCSDVAGRQAARARARVPSPGVSLFGFTKLHTKLIKSALQASGIIMAYRLYI